MEFGRSCVREFGEIEVQAFVISRDREFVGSKYGSITELGKDVLRYQIIWSIFQ